MNKWKTIDVGIEEIVHTEVNANQMSKKQFDKLVANIRRSGLSSAIACYRRGEDGKYVIISGNHRYRACVTLGYSRMAVIYAEEKDLSRDEIIAVQLSHNSLHGEDDKGILKRLFEEIQSVEFKEFAHITVDDLIAQDMFSGSITPVSEHYQVALILYRRDIELLGELLGIVEGARVGNEVVLLADGGEGIEEEFLQVTSEIKKQFDIKSVSVAFSKLLRLAREAMVADVAESDKKGEGVGDGKV